MSTNRLKASLCILGSMLLAACQQNIPAPVVVAPAPVATPAPKVQPKKVTPKPKKQVKEEEDWVPVLPLRPHEVGSRTSILP